MTYITWLRRHLVSGAGVVLLIALAVAIPDAAKQFPQEAVSNGCSGSMPAGWVVLRGHIPPLLAQAQVLHATNPARRMQLSISFRLRKQAELEELLREQETPGSPTYETYLTPQEFQARFGPTSDMMAQLQRFLTSQGLQMKSAVGQMTSFTGTVKQVECTFAVKINDYHLQGRTIFASATDPAVPANIAPSILAILGLNNLAVAHPLVPLGPSS